MFQLINAFSPMGESLTRARFSGGKACCHLGGNSILGRFFLGGKVGPGLIYPRGKFYTRPIFPGGKSILQHRVNSLWIWKNAQQG